MPADKASPSAPATPPLPKHPHALHIGELIGHLRTHPERGLSPEQTEIMRGQHGANVLRQAPRTPWWRRLLGQFTDVVVGILVVAAILSALQGDWLDSCVIFAIVLTNGLLGLIQEERAERAMAAIHELSAPQAKVVREGRLQNIPASEIVPGDRIELEPGDRVPADARLLSSAGFQTHEAPLTGESTPVEKDHREPIPVETPLAERRNIVHMGTTVSRGTASAVVVSTGMNTQIGQIAGLLQRHVPEPTPLQRKLTQLGKTLVYAVLGIVAIIFMLHVFRGGGLLEVFMISVSLAVAAVPEGLPAVVTIALALGVQRMARHHALVRRLPSVETLGAVTVICSDKTGTLTRNEMTVRELFAGKKHYDVSGAGYAPEGGFRIRGETADVDPQSDADLLRLLRVGAWCNHSDVSKGKDGNDWEVVGDPTEAAILVAARKANVRADPRSGHITHEIPFSSERKAMSVVVRHDKTFVMYAKGAPEKILGKCSRILRDGIAEALTQEQRREVLDKAHEMAQRALRVLALAYREDVQDHEDEEEDLIFAGLAGMIDPPRDEAREAVKLCGSAGIRAVMITGDHPDTAKAVAAELGMLQPRQRVISGSELDAIDDAQLAEQVEEVAVYARVSAEHKLRVIAAWRSRGHVVAMTGDGVNDAPALKAADVGVAMGITGTDVSKEASDIVLTDDNFATIVRAVEEGRTIFDSIRKFVHYLLATNAGEMLLMFAAALLGWSAPLVATQILWINLVTDALPALALGVEPAEPDVMTRPPKSPTEPVISRRAGLVILYHGLLVATPAMVAYWLFLGGDESNLDSARTAAFGTIAFSQLFFSFGCRSDRYTMPQLGALSNRWLIGAVAASFLLQLAVLVVPLFHPLFKTVSMRPHEWGMVIGLALIPVTVIELTKFAYPLRR